MIQWVFKPKSISLKNGGSISNIEFCEFCGFIREGPCFKKQNKFLNPLMTKVTSNTNLEKAKIIHLDFDESYL